MRDQQGVYHFNWLQPGATSGSGTPAAASLLKLAQADTPSLDIPSGGDPVLNITPNTPIQLATASTPTPGTQRTVEHVYWNPFYGGYYYGPRYYDPPSQPAPSSGGTVNGSTSSTAPRPAAERTFGVTHAVSGRAGGAGAGVAASNKSGASVDSSGGKSSSAAPKSSGFSSGKGVSGSSGGSGSSAGSSSS
jgi:hypothetical protein